MLSSSSFVVSIVYLCCVWCLCWYYIMQLDHSIMILWHRHCDGLFTVIIKQQRDSARLSSRYIVCSSDVKACKMFSLRYCSFYSSDYGSVDRSAKGKRRFIKYNKMDLFLCLFLYYFHLFLVAYWRGVRAFVSCELDWLVDVVCCEKGNWIYGTMRCQLLSTRTSRLQQQQSFQTEKSS